MASIVSCVLVSFQVFDSKGQFLHQFGSRGKADGEIWYPAGVCIDKSGQIYVADHGNNRIQVRKMQPNYSLKCARFSVEQR